MSRIRNSIELVKTCWAVLRQDRSLLWLPVLSLASTLVTFALFGLGVSASRTTELNGQSKLTLASYALMLVGYLSLSIITVFFNAALISAANERLTGGDPTVESALAGATARFRRIAPWALVSATVSLIVRTIQERGGIIGRVIGGIAGIAWALVTFLVLPVIVIEGLSVGDALKRSKELFLRNWGEQMVGNAAIGLAAFLAMAVEIPIMLAVAAVGSGPLMVALIVLGIAWFLAVSCVSTAMSAIFQTALYRYASTGVTSEGFTPQQLAGAFRPKSGRSGWGG